MNTYEFEQIKAAFRIALDDFIYRLNCVRWTKENMIYYGTKSRDYCERAKDLIRSREKCKLIYAALELRLGIETRMKEYLEVQEHVSERKKKGWKIANLSKSIESAFSQENKIVKLTVTATDKHKYIGVYWYIPVSSSLQHKAEQLGDLLHSKKASTYTSEKWWSEKRGFLESTLQELEVALKGTLLGPPLANPKTGAIELKTEIISEEDAKWAEVDVNNFPLTYTYDCFSNTPLGDPQLSEVGVRGGKYPSR